MKALKYNIIGLCHYRQKLFDEAKKNYEYAININYYFVQPRYHLAVLYVAQNNRNKAIECLNECIKIDRTYQPALHALKILNQSRKIDWISWWGFGEKARKTIGLSLIVLIVAEILSIFYLVLFGKSVSSNAVLVRYAALGITVLLLILPNLKNLEIAKFLKVTIVTLGNEETAVDLEVARPFTDDFPQSR